jgi:uncharacterized BrkB/YihY/UPF0761 family membrane protein
MAIVEPYLRGLVAGSKRRFLTLGLAVALYSASRGVNAVRTALNRAYDVKESRPLWKTELLAFGMTVGGGLLMLVGSPCWWRAAAPDCGRLAISPLPTCTSPCSGGSAGRSRRW